MLDLFLWLSIGVVTVATIGLMITGIAWWATQTSRHSRTASQSSKNAEHLPHADTSGMQQQITQSAEMKPVASSSDSVPMSSSPPRQHGFLLPSIELLDASDKSKYDLKDVKRQVAVIEETLAGFDIPAKVIEANKGSRITQFA